MKKVAIGCSAVLAVLLVIGLVAGYWLFSSARKLVGGYQELAQISTINQQVVDQSTYRPPANQQMTSDQVERYVQVQRALMTHLGDRIDALEKEYRQLEATLQDGQQPSWRQMWNAWGDIVTLIVDTKRAQVDELNRAGFSLSEYQWVRSQVWAAWGHTAMGWNLEAIAANPEQIDAAWREVSLPPDDVLQRHRELLQPHVDESDNWMALSFFGL